MVALLRALVLWGSKSELDGEAVSFAYHSDMLLVV